MKRVLVVHFSQTGQLARVARRLSSPLAEAPDVELVEEVLRPSRPYPFPWPAWRFLDAMPESVLLEPPALEPLKVRADQHFDLVVLAYQVWFLAPSGPITAFLKSEAGRQLLRGRPVVTLITTPRWLLTGRRGAFWGLPAAGVAEEDVAGADRFGRALLAALRAGRERAAEPMLAGLGAARVDPRLIFSERAGCRAFALWSRLIRLGGPQGSAGRVPLLALFCVYLVAMILAVVPTSLLLQRLLSPLLAERLELEKTYFELP